MSAQLAQALKAARRLGKTNKFDEYRAALMELGRAYLAAFEAAPQQAQAPKSVCMDQFCACRGGPCASCEEGEREAELASLRSSLEFYKRRCDLLQQWQSKMRDPERVLVCDILANGQTLPESTGRYALPEAQQAQAPGWQLVPVEPTIQMLMAGGMPRLSLEHPTIHHAVWAAMLKAAPQQAMPVPDSPERHEIDDALDAWECPDCGGAGKRTVYRAVTHQLGTDELPFMETCETCGGVGYCGPGAERRSDTANTSVRSSK